MLPTNVILPWRFIFVRWFNVSSVNRTEIIVLRVYYGVLCELG